MGWTDDRVETLTKLWLNGVSASKCAAALGGFTRNAVIGKVHRLKLCRPPRKNVTGWTDERITLMTKLWLAGMPKPLIVEKLGDTTYAAVNAKIRALGLSGEGGSALALVHTELVEDALRKFT